MSKKLPAIVLSVAVLGGLAAATRALTAQERSNVEQDGRVSVFRFGGSYLGVHIADVDADAVRDLGLPGEYGVRLVKVEPDTPAEKAGLQVDDVLVGWAGERLRSTRQLRRILDETPAGREVDVEVIRNKKSRSVRVKLAENSGENFAFRSSPGGTFQVRPEGLDQLRERMRHMAPDGSGGNAFFFSSGTRLGASIQSLGSQLGEYFGMGDRKGVLVTAVTEESAASKAGLRAGDIILKVGGESVENPGELMKAIREADSGTVELRILRDRKERSLAAELPEEAPSRLRRSAPGGAQSYYFSTDGLDPIVIDFEKLGDVEFLMPDLEPVWKQLEGLGDVFERAFEGAEIRWHSPEEDAEREFGARSTVSA